MTYPNSSGLSKEVDGRKGPLLVPRFQFLLEFRRRGEVHSGSLLHGRHKTVNLKKRYNVRAASFIWGKMRTIAQEIAFQIALRNGSKEAAGKVSIYVILVKGEYIQSSTYFFCRSFLLVTRSSHHHEGF